MNKWPEIQNDSIFKYICHRIPERTFKIRNTYFPVCSRCTGIYLGSFLYFIYAYYVYIDYTIPLIFMGVLMIIPTFMDGFTQLINIRKSNNILRFFTGLVGGIGLGIIVKSLKVFLLTGSL